MEKRETLGNQKCLGALPHGQGVTFRVWAPHAQRVYVTGSFNNWSSDTHLMESYDEGCWEITVSDAAPGDEYRYVIHNGEQMLSRIDPYAYEVTNSVGNAIVPQLDFDWEEDTFVLPSWNEIVIYEMHIGTFHKRDQESENPGTFAEATERLRYLKQLGVNVIQIMPAAEFAGDYSWGYNPAHIFAVESSYGGPRAFKEFVKRAHQAGFAVIFDVVYNHFGPSDLDLWQFDGWHENNLGGIYFYNDWRSETPWGATRPDYGRREVRQFIRDNALFWLEEYHVDGLRFDMTLYIRSVRGDGDSGGELPDGWSLCQLINNEIRERFPRCITIAEDLQENEWLTKSSEDGGAGFGTQWDNNFVHPIRAAVTADEDGHRSMEAVQKALSHRYNGDVFQRVIYSESHDEVANGKARVPHEIAGAEANSWFAQKRSTLAAALVFTAPGIPMLFQGQEFLQGGWFQDTVPLDWNLTTEYHGILRLYRDLIHLRLNRSHVTRGLCGQGITIHHVNEAHNVIAFHRWDQSGPGDDVIIVANFANQIHENYAIGFPHEGAWKLRLNSDWIGYSDNFANTTAGDVIAEQIAYDNYSYRAVLVLPPYSFLIFSQDP